MKGFRLFFHEGLEDKRNTDGGEPTELPGRREAGVRQASARRSLVATIAARQPKPASSRRDGETTAEAMIGGGRGSRMGCCRVETGGRGPNERLAKTAWRRKREEKVDYAARMMV
ncbi:MAG: hypothetical protein KJ749_01815 [Planctomycetes bacterium]|nr:hypothetical protein [Planctomycetota bacterium]